MGSHAPRSSFSSSPSHAPSLANTVAAFTPQDVAALDRVVRQLSVEDLRALATFPGQPHVLIHAVVASVHCLLLTLSTPKHQLRVEVVKLEAPPWPLLRLELLSNAPQVYEKLHKKLQQLQQQQHRSNEKKRRVGLVPAQLWFVSRTLEPFYDKERGARPSLHGSGALCAEYPVVLEMYARVSSIAAQLAAWVLLCLASSSSSAGVGAKRAKGHCSGSQSPEKPSLYLLPPLATEAQLHRRHDNTFPDKQSTVLKRVKVSVRAGWKIGGRFFLFQATCSSDLAARLSQSPPSHHHHRHHQHQQQMRSSMIQWAVLRMDTIRKSDKLRRPTAPSTNIPLAHDNDENAKRSSSNGFWNPRQRVQSRLSRALFGSERWRWIPKCALATTLFQLGLHAHVFENPDTLHHCPAVSPVAGSPPIMLKFAAVVTSHSSANLFKRSTRQRQQQHRTILMGIGNALIEPSYSVAALRLEIQSAMLRARAQNTKTSGRDVTIAPQNAQDFAFLYRGSLLPIVLESSLSVFALMPFALIIQAGENDGAGHIEAAIVPSVTRYCAAQLQRLHLAISIALKNTGPPNHLLHIGDHEAPVASLTQEIVATYYEMHQELIEPQITTTADVLTEFFVNWRAFVHFQLLQDSTSVLELSSQEDPQRAKDKTKRICKTEAQKIAEFQAESAHQLLLLQSREPRVALPSKRFNAEKEYLRPLYALADVQSTTTAILTTPFVSELYNELFNNSDDETSSSSTARLRLVLYDEDVVVHVTSARLLLPLSSHHTSEPQTQAQVSLPPVSSSPKLEISFERDATCPINALVLLRNAYVWQIVNLKPTDDWDINIPDKWLQDVLRFVTHPHLDFSSTTTSNGASVPTHLTFFRVPMAIKNLETRFEASFWSKSVDWRPFLRSTNVCERAFRRKFELLSQSHPPSVSGAIDSLKFSKLLREIAIQPQVLSIGDVTFLFTSHLTSGSHYEMDFDGFLAAMTKIARRLYLEPGSPKKKTNKAKHQAQFIAQDDQLNQQLPASNPSLRQLFFERMIHAPSMLGIWQELMDSWRLECKLALLSTFAREFGAATRIQALWRCFATQRVHLKVLLLMKAQRKAVIRIQSLERRRRVYQPFHTLKAQVMRVQLRVKARSELRRLRRERTALVERMRLRIVRWMRQRLRILHEWKKLNQIWVQQRERIWEKRKRLVCACVGRLESRSLRFSLYRAAADGLEATRASPLPVLGEQVSEDSSTGEIEAEPDKWYDLEVLEPITCWWRSVRVPGRLILRFISEEEERVVGTVSDPKSVSAQQKAREVDRMIDPLAPVVQGNRLLGITSGPRGSKSRSSGYLNALARRLFLRRPGDRVECFRNPIQTSLGKLVFNGAVSVKARTLDTGDEGRVQEDALCLVKLLQRMSVFTVLVYFPSSCQLRRWDVSAKLAYEMLQFMRFRHLILLPDSPVNASAVEDQRRLFELQGFFTSIIAIQNLVTYVVTYGLAPPLYENTLEVLTEKKCQRLEREACELGLQHKREEKLVVFAQTRVRRFLARRCRLRLALGTYRKQFDFTTGGFIYVNRFSRESYSTSKPPSLFDCDVPLPANEWQRVLEPISAAEKFFNPFRGVFSKFNEEKAASCVQSWFRKKMWIGISDWGLQQLARALRFHQQVVHMPPAQLIATGDVQAMKRSAFYLHVMEHEFKGALTTYEAILKVQSLLFNHINPEDVEALVGLAVLLIYSCRYPTKLTWPRAQSLLAQAHQQVSFDVSEELKSLEENCFCWKMFLEPKNAHAMGNYAVFLQVVRHELDKAELLYRRAIDADPSNELAIENYRRLERERTPEGVYSFTGPSKIARWRSREVKRIDSLWVVMEDSAARIHSAQRFYRNSQTGACQWQRPLDLD